MSDRSDEATESRDPDDLLEETEDLLSETGAGVDTGAETDVGAPSAPEDRPTAGGDVGVDDSFDADPVFSSDEPAAGTADAAPDADSGTGTGSRLGRLASRLSVDDYFSPRAFLAALLLVGGGLVAGATVVPFGGRLIGMFGAAFVVGLLTSERRYLEMTAAGTSVGAVSAVLGNAVIAMAGSFQRVVAVGVAIGLLATVIGYYFGRDLRAGLTKDIE